jgi:hypothetical protein
MMAKRGRPPKLRNPIEAARIEARIVTEEHPAKRAYTIAPTVVDPGIACPHCKCREGHGTNDVKKTPFGSRHYMTCGGCKKRFFKLTFKTKSAI